MLTTIIIVDFSEEIAKITERHWSYPFFMSKFELTKSKAEIFWRSNDSYTEGFNTLHEAIKHCEENGHLFLIKKYPGRKLWDCDLNNFDLPYTEKDIGEI